MGTPGSTSNVTRADIRSVFARLDPPSTPITADEVAETLECERRTARSGLEELVERGDLQTRQVASTNRVWWRDDGRTAADPGADREEFTAFVSAVRDYAIFMLDPDGRVINWNDGAERIKGYAEDEIVGEHFSTFYTDDDVKADVPETNLETAATEGRVEDEGWRVRKDGSRFWANVVITAVRDDGTLRGFTKVTRDMTERRAYEQQLRRERDLTERVLETVPVSIFVSTADGDFVRANQQLLDRLDIDESALAEYSVDSWEIYDADGEPIPIDEWPLMRVTETGEPVYDYQCRVNLPNVGQRWLSINAAPIEDEYHEHDRIVFSIDDITEQKERERQLRREYDQTEKLLRTAPIAIAVQNAEGETVMANQRAQDALDLSEREFIEEPEDAEQWEISDANGESLSSDETPTARALATGEPVLDEELVFDSPRDERLHFRVNAAPVFGPDGSIERVVTTGEDITELKRRERQLERRKTELETELGEILDRISDAFYALDDEWRFTHLNEYAAELLQQPGDELLGREVWDVFPDARDGVYREQFRTAMESQEPVSFEVYGEDLDAWLEFNAYPSETGLSIYFRDVTERVERERELRLKERRFEAIFEDPNILVGLLDPDGTVLDINRTAMEYIDADLEDVTGEPFWETPWWGEGEDRDEDVRADVEEWVERTAAGEYVDFEADLTRPNGERYTINGVFRPVTNDDGEVVSIIVSDRDITERKKRERQLEESERRYRTLVEHFPNGAVALVDEDLRYQTVGGNPFDVASVTADAVEGQPVADVLPEALADELVPRYAAALDGEAGAFELELDGRTFQFQVVPVRDDGGDVFAALGMSQDITERREYERKLEESNERLEQFAYAASHDLQEPLRMVSSYLQLIEHRYGDALDEDGEEFLAYAVDGAERMKTMIEGLLEYSRVETQGDPFEPIDLDTVVADVRSDLQLHIEEHDAEIAVESLPRVEGDPDQLRQVFQNLLDNAIEYSGDEPPEVRVSAERAGRMWVVSVSDEGIGIDRDDADRIFEVFQRLHTQAEHPGTGIGLALCQRIVERHGGEIWVESEPGEGATFSFTLPAADEPGVDR